MVFCDANPRLNSRLMKTLWDALDVCAPYAILIVFWVKGYQFARKHDSSVMQAIGEHYTWTWTFPMICVSLILLRYVERWVEGQQGWIAARLITCICTICLQTCMVYQIISRGQYFWGAWRESRRSGDPVGSLVRAWEESRHNARSAIGYGIGVGVCFCMMHSAHLISVWFRLDRF